MYKPLADSTLMAMSKKEIIEHLRCIEHNHIVLKAAYYNAVNENKCNHCILPKKLEEQEKQIRAEVIDSFVNECVKFEDLTFSKEQIERIKLIAEQLKENRYEL